MKRHLLFPLLAFTAFSFGQTQLDNPGFEGAWEDVLGDQDEPAEWSSLKTADALAALAPVVMAQSTDSHSGSYAVRLTNIETLLVANGIMTNGRVHADFDAENGYIFTDPSDNQWNQSFSARPDSVVAWIKYAPTAGDRGKIEILLHTDEATGKLPETGSNDHWVAKARYDITTPSAEWTRVSAPFDYYSADNPDYILVVITSGDSTIALAGSQMWVDDVELVYNADDASVSPNEFDFDIFSNDNMVTIKSTDYQGGQISFFTVDGRTIYDAKLTEEVSLIELNTSGVILYSLQKDGHLSTGKIHLD